MVTNYSEIVLGRHVPIKRAPWLNETSLAAVLAQRDETVAIALCRIADMVSQVSYFDFTITPEGLSAIREDVCDACIVRVALMAANDLTFTNDGLTKLLELLEAAS
ncbi:MAG: hypothetical protein WAV09_02965 [Minisyncoccia bacterium]